MEHVLGSPDKLLPINHDDLAVFKRYEEAQPLVLTEVGAECWGVLCFAISDQCLPRHLCRPLRSDFGSDTSLVDRRFSLQIMT